jgi:hypothetical protein
VATNRFLLRPTTLDRLSTSSSTRVNGSRATRDMFLGLIVTYVPFGPVFLLLPVVETLE